MWLHRKLHRGLDVQVVNMGDTDIEGVNNSAVVKTVSFIEIGNSISYAHVMEM